MVEVEIQGKKTLCFMVKRGEKNLIVIPIDGLLKVDYNRLTNLESQGGELMRVMRDTILDNGKNALEMYEPLLKHIPVKEKKIDKTDKQILVETDVEQKPAKRGRGRPRKNPIKS